MVERALHTRLRPGAEADYDAVHAEVSAELMAALAEAGVRDWRIWRDGRDVFHLVDVDDYARMRAHLRDHPVNLAWQQRLAPLFETADDHSGADDGITPVWGFARQRGDARSPRP